MVREREVTYRPCHHFQLGCTVATWWRRRGLWVEGRRGAQE
jgi:hypothetical protein